MNAAKTQRSKRRNRKIHKYLIAEVNTCSLSNGRNMKTESEDTDYWITLSAKQLTDIYGASHLMTGTEHLFQQHKEHLARQTMFWNIKNTQNYKGINILQSMFSDQNGVKLEIHYKKIPGKILKYLKSKQQIFN